MSPHPRTAARALTAFLFLTGGTALVYQVLWSRYLALLLGSSAVAVVVVLAAFMGGLAAGSFLFGRLADRPIRRLTLYAWLEMGVGVYCLLFPGLLSALQGPYLKLVAPLHGGHPGLFTAARLLFAALLLVPPTVLMGGTLPAATRFLLGLEPGIRRAVAHLYWVNSLGAVLGALLCGFWLIPNLGLDLSVDLAALVNVAVGIAAIALRARLGEDPTAAAAADAAEEPLPARAGRAALAAVTLSGFAALVMEVAWTRFLALVLGGSTFSFTLMVATFILGIALGSRWISGVGGSGRQPLLALAGLLAAVAAVLALSLPAYPEVPYLFHWLRSFVQRSPEAYPLYQVVLFLVCAMVMLVPTAAMGATLPLASRITTPDPSAAGGRVGLTWALNTAGTLLGAVLAGLVLLPRVGLQGTLKLAVAAYAVAAAVALAGLARPGRGALAVGAVAALSMAGVLAGPAWPMAHLASGEYRHRDPFQPRADWVRRLDELTLLSHEDGATCSVTVLDRPGGDRSLRVNGKPDASNGLDMYTQVLAGHLPAFLASPDAREALVIGVGSGATIAALATHRGLAVTAVEIEPAVVRAARLHFRDVNEGVLDDPRVRVVLDDAKTIFQVDPRRWDVVISEPSNPWVAGIGGLFTQEFFEQARSRLAPGGIFAQWLQAYETDDDAVRMVLRTFRRVFPQVTVWYSGVNDYLLVGSAGPQAPPPALLEARFAPPEVQRSLARIRVGSVPALLARQVLSPASVDRLVGVGPSNSDRFPVLEFAAPRAFFVGRVVRLFTDADERGQAPGEALLYHQVLRQRPLDAAGFRLVARSLERQGPRLHESVLLHAIRLDPASQELIDDLAGLPEVGWDAQRIAALAAQLRPASASGQAEVLRRQAGAAVERCLKRRTGLAPQRCDDAVRLQEELVRRLSGDPAEQRAQQNALGRLYLATGRPADALALADRLLTEGSGDAGRLQAGRAAALLELGDGAGARRAAEEALRLAPDNGAARQILERPRPR